MDVQGVPVIVKTIVFAGMCMLSTKVGYMCKSSYSVTGSGYFMAARRDLAIMMESVVFKRKCLHECDMYASLL